MTFQPEPIVPDSVIQVFDPPMDYTRNENADDPTKPNTAGGLKKPDQGKDRKTRTYPDGTGMKIHDTREAARQGSERPQQVECPWREEQSPRTLDRQPLRAAQREGAV
jgi:hypothetical protein